MIITFPHMGTLSIVLKTLFTKLDCQVVAPPPITKYTMELGAQLSPETVCLPFKITLGNFIEALEEGADTIITCGGEGPCRLGYYAAVQQAILEQLGYKFTMLVIEPNIVDIYKQLRYIAPRKNWISIYKAFQLAGAKMNLLDDILRELNRIRPHVADGRKVERIWLQALQAVDVVEAYSTVKELKQNILKTINELPLAEGPTPLRVAVVGEIYVMQESFVNQSLDRRLGEMGVEVVRTMCLSDYVRGHLLRRRNYMELYQQLNSLAKPYLGHHVGGHGLESIAYTILKKHQGYDGIIQVYPFTCMPEVVAKNILPKVSMDVNMPVLTLAYDEQTGEAGIITRLEAFVDLLKYRKNKENVPPVSGSGISL
ncbi:hypothetical protein SRRS_03590 [Sporomusa rhizae]|uniref:acyl-CoA dehydratase activase-related protein n=1 Tax=Sporomusa rhizae TaxID=357999 RepID=UPI00352B5C46